MYPSQELINANNRLVVVERTRIRRANAFNQILLRELGIRKVADIPKDAREGFIGIIAASQTGVIDEHDAFFDQMEKGAIKVIEREVKNSPYADFIDARNGVGAKGFGRVWANIGSPITFYDRYGNEQDRTVGRLFQYCGVGDPNNKRKAGVKLQSNLKIGPRLHVIAENAGVKVSGAYYRSVYDAAKSDAQGRLHSGPCSPCGTKSETQKLAQKEADEQSGGVLKLKNDVPAGVGDPWRLGHIHGHALRQVKREFLRDLFKFTLGL